MGTPAHPKYQVVILRVPFRPEIDPDTFLLAESVPSTWNWTDLCDSPEPVVVIDCDPVSEDPDVQPIERLPDEPLSHVGTVDEQGLADFVDAARIAVGAADNWCDYLDGNDRDTETPPVEDALSTVRSFLPHVTIQDKVPGHG